MCRDSDAIRGAIFVVANEARGARRGDEANLAVSIGDVFWCRASSTRPAESRARPFPTVSFPFGDDERVVVFTDYKNVME